MGEILILRGEDMKQAFFVAIQIILLIVSGVIIYGGRKSKFAFISNDKLLFVTYVVMGIILCSIGILFRVMGPYMYKTASDWFFVGNILQGLLGVLAVGVIVIGFTQKEVGFIKDYASAANVLAVVIIAKQVISVLKAVMNK